MIKALNKILLVALFSVVSTAGCVEGRSNGSKQSIPSTSFSIAQTEKLSMVAGSVSTYPGKSVIPSNQGINSNNALKEIPPGGMSRTIQVIEKMNPSTQLFLSTAFNNFDHQYSNDLVSLAEVLFAISLVPGLQSSSLLLEITLADSTSAFTIQIYTYTTPQESTSTRNKEPESSDIFLQVSSSSTGSNPSVFSGTMIIREPFRLNKDDLRSGKTLTKTSYIPSKDIDF